MGDFNYKDLAHCYHSTDIFNASVVVHLEKLCPRGVNSGAELY